MIRVGIVGIGFMGMTHFRAYQHVRGARVVAICEPDAKRRAGDWRDIKGNFGAPGTIVDLKGIATYADWHELLQDPSIDMVDICLPPSMHADATVAALRAGKHVMCEKPISVVPADAARMVQAARKSGKLLMIGHVLPMFGEYAFARNVVTSGKYGKLLGGHFKRIISDPLWLRDFYDPKKVGGPVIDLHIHDVHFIRVLCGMPSAVFSTGRMKGDTVGFLTTNFLYDPSDLAVTATSGVIDQQGRGFTHAFEIYLEKATLLYDSSVIDGKPVVGMPLTVLKANGKVERPKLKEGDAFAAELTEVVRAVSSGKPSDLLSGELARDALTICYKEIESVRKGRLVKVS